MVFLNNKVSLFIKQKINSKLFRDSFWAVFGNGIGNALMLLSGIIIARLLGKDLYGEYGIVKTTMFYIASFATLGLGVTSTKYIASLISQNSTHVGNVIRDSMHITLLFSGLIAFVLFLSSSFLANFLNEASLAIAFKTLAIIIIFKAITTTQIGILAGFKKFKTIAVNSVCSGLAMFVLSIPLTYVFGLKGSLLTLLLSQMFNTLINFYSVRKESRITPMAKNVSYKKELIFFSFPVALQESSFTICNWVAIMMLTKYSSLGEVGVYTASAQWNSIITMIPGLLVNVVLSYLSGSVNAKRQHEKTLKLMLCINFATTIFPFVIVYILANYIASFYGESFGEMSSVLRVLTFSTILEACSSVYKSELLALGKTWLLFSIRFVRDLILVLSVFMLLNYTDGYNGAIMYSWAVVIMSTIFFLVLFLTYKIEKIKKEKR